MGIFGQLLTRTKRTVFGFHFDYIDAHPTSQKMAEEFENIFRTTKWISWGSDYLTWYAIDRTSSNGEFNIQADFSSRNANGPIYVWQMDEYSRLIISPGEDERGEMLKACVVYKDETILLTTVDLCKC